MDEFRQEISRSDYEQRSTSAILQEDASSNELNNLELIKWIVEEHPRQLITVANEKQKVWAATFTL